MKPPLGAIRHTLAVAGAVLVGAAATVTLASPASAHHPIVRGTPACDSETGTWRVTWTVANSERDLEGTLTAVTLTPSGSTVTNVAVGAQLPVSTAAPLTGVQILPATATSAKLMVTAEWQRPGRVVTQSASGSVTFQGQCSIPTQPKPAAAFASQCDGSVTTTLLNSEGATASARFEVTGTDGYQRTETVKPNDSLDVVVPAANAAKVTVTSGRKIIATGAYKDPETCALPEKTVAQTCDSISLSFANPDSGRAVTGRLTPSTGDEVPFTLPPGESKSTTFAGTDGLTVAITVTGLEAETIAWAKPSSCAPALPDTGSSLTTAIGWGVALVAVGAGILFFFRRRRGAHARF